MKQFKVHYRGSYFWLIFWIIVFFPVALVLLFTGCSFDINEKRYVFGYHGSRFWLGFWTLLFFPVALILMFVNGVWISEEGIDQPFNH